MVEKFARLLVQRSVSWTVVVITILLTVAAIVLSGTVEQDDDLLAFLPKTDPDIAAFQEINNTFGGTDIAMVGISTDNVFDTAFLTKLRDTTKSLGDVGGLDQVLSLTSVPDFREDPNTGGIETSSLVQTIPTTEAEMAELKDRVMRREHIVGTFISEDADAVLLLGFVSKAAHKGFISDFKSLLSFHPSLHCGGAVHSGMLSEAQRDGMNSITA